MIAKRSRAHRSRCGRSSIVLNFAPIALPRLRTARGIEGYKAAYDAAIDILCGYVRDPRITWIWRLYSAAQ